MGRIENNPCRYCTPPKRNEWCHSVCKEYAEYRAGLDIQSKKMYQDKEADNVIAEGFITRKIRHYKRGGKH